MGESISIQILKDYEQVPSIRFLCKKYHMGNRAIRKHILEAGGSLNFKKGTTKNYKANSGSFKKGQSAWNEGINMGESFSNMRHEVMMRLIDEGKYTPISLRPGVAEKISKSKTGERNWMFGKVDELAPNWKGDDVGYAPLHQWVHRHKGKALVCQFCGSTENVQWANKSLEYKRDLNDWLELCCKCHRKYDRENGWGKATLKYPELKAKRKNLIHG